MALGIPTDQRGQIMALLVLVALAGGYFFWTKVHKPNSAKISAAHAEADSLERIVAAAKADLANGSIEDLRRRVEEYRGSLELMRRLVPERNEVPTLIGDMSTKGKVRGGTPCSARAWRRKATARARPPTACSRARCCAKYSPMKEAGAIRSCRCCDRATCGRCSRT